MAGETLIDSLVDRLAVRAQAAQVEVPPAAVLWPDRTREWQSLIPQVAARTRLVILGDYVPEQMTGPAYWIRCVIDGTIEIDSAADGIPVIYLPGYARTDIRAVEDADDALKPLAELVYRGTTFAHPNGRDWTIAGFLESKTHGLGLAVADDQMTKAALLRAASELANVPVQELRHEAPLKAAFFDGLMSPDIDRDVLRWLNDRPAFETSCTREQLEAFRSAFAEQFNADLGEGKIGLARQLGLGGSRWAKVWQRYEEAPARYPHIRQLLTQARPERKGQGNTLFEGVWGRWPQDNAEDEDRLRKALSALANAPAAEVASAVRALEREHAARRTSVWATLGEAPLAFALRHLARLAQTTQTLAAPSDCSEAAAWYSREGWETDDAVIQALASVKSQPDRAAVTAAIRPTYEPWLEETARRFQRVVGDDGSDYMAGSAPTWPAGTCVIFFDGLRYDIAKRLAAELSRDKRDVTVEPRLTALPTLTATAKPAVSPIAENLVPGKYFAPASKDGGPDLAVAGLRSLLEAAEYQVLMGTETGDPAGRAWTELGDLDEVGHLQPWNLPEQSGREIEKLAERINALVDAGWKQVVVVTDHGWLFLPGGLPKVDFPISVTKDDRGRKARTARLADGAEAPGKTVPWFWDPSVRMAVAPGIARFIGTDDYEHGGVSPQECVTPVVIVRSKVEASGRVEIEVQWAGLRARVSVSGPGVVTVDIRRKAGEPQSSLAVEPRTVDATGSAGLLVPDEDAEGTLAFVVALDDKGTLLAQAQTTIGGG